MYSTQESRVKRNSEKWGWLAAIILVVSGLVFFSHMTGILGPSVRVSGWWVAVASAASTVACVMAINDGMDQEGDTPFILGAFVSLIMFAVFLVIGIVSFF